MFTSFIHSSIGAVHMFSALIAMILGASVLLMDKGTLRHKRVGYGYVMAMILVDVTAFMIYHLFGKFGPFHVAAIISGLCIVAGVVPAFFKRRIKHWLYFHYYFMNWSIIGLYAAFWAETLVRLFPMKQFWPIVVIATALTTFTGAYLVNRYRAKFFKDQKSGMPPSESVFA